MDNLEAWLKGPIEGVPSLLQPVAHALTQANAEIHAMMENLPAGKLWDQPAGVASAGRRPRIGRHPRGIVRQGLGRFNGRRRQPQPGDRTSS